MVVGNHGKTTNRIADLQDRTWESGPPEYKADALSLRYRARSKLPQLWKGVLLQVKHKRTLRLLSDSLVNMCIVLKVCGSCYWYIMNALCMSRSPSFKFLCGMVAAPAVGRQRRFLLCLIFATHFLIFFGLLICQCNSLGFNYVSRVFDVSYQQTIAELRIDQLR
jgi:hypothetical protein